MKYYYDIESNGIVSEAQILAEYLKLPENDQINIAFSEYLSNCMTRNNGTLETIPQRKKIIEKRIDENNEIRNEYQKKAFENQQELNRLKKRMAMLEEMNLSYKTDIEELDRIIHSDTVELDDLIVYAG